MQLYSARFRKLCGLVLVLMVLNMSFIYSESLDCEGEFKFETACNNECFWMESHKKDKIKFVHAKVQSLGSNMINPLFECRDTTLEESFNLYESPDYLENYGEYETNPYMRAFKNIGEWYPEETGRNLTDPFVYKFWNKCVLSEKSAETIIKNKIESPLYQFCDPKLNFEALGDGVENKLLVTDWKIKKVSSNRKLDYLYSFEECSDPNVFQNSNPATIADCKYEKELKYELYDGKGLPLCSPIRSLKYKVTRLYIRNIPKLELVKYIDKLPPLTCVIEPSCEEPIEKGGLSSVCKPSQEITEGDICFKGSERRDLGLFGGEQNYKCGEDERCCIPQDKTVPKI